MKLPMKGWKTWLGVIALAINGVVSIAGDDPQQGIMMLMAAWTAIGLGAKAEKK